MPHNLQTWPTHPLRLWAIEPTHLTLLDAEILSAKDPYPGYDAESGHIKGRGRRCSCGVLHGRWVGYRRADSTHVIAAIRVLKRLELVGETVRYALNSLAVIALDWLRAEVPSARSDRYGTRIENYHLPQTAAAREALAATIGADGRQLPQAVDASTDRPWLREVPAVQTLRQIWAEQYTDPSGPLRWRAVQEWAPAAELIASPYDPEARYSTKRGIAWVGYKIHLTETCDDS